jgi:hypothetical protein
MSDRLKKIKKNKALEEMKRTLAYSLSDADIRHILGQGTKIIEYCDLDKFSSMDDLLPGETDYVIILIESQDNSGHWCAITKRDKVISMMDSYGIKLQDELNFISRAVNRMLGNTKEELEKLIKSCPDDVEVIYNKTPLQHQSPSICTCGRWCAAYIQLFKLGYSLCEFLEIVQAQCEEYGVPPDVLVCKWVNLVR